MKEAFLKKEGLFLKDPSHPSFDTHKLHGKYKGYLAFTVTGQYRVMFRFLGRDDEVGFINIGTHEIYK